MNYRDEILVWMSHARKVIYGVAESALAGEESANLTHSQARDVMKIGLQAVRATKKVVGERGLIAVHDTWNTDALKELIEQMERSPEYNKASGLLQMMKQMKALIDGVQKKSSENAERATQGLASKKEMKKELRKKRKVEDLSNMEDEGDESGKRKKKRIKSSEAKNP